jgi:arylsulfatase A-like enzyme
VFVPGAAAADGQDVLHCVRPALERIVDDVAPQALRPNIIVVLTDDQRWDTLGVMPRTTALAREGVTFDNAFVTTAICCPSRASLYSGQYAHHHGVLSNGDILLFRDESTLPVWLSQVGYATALFGKYLNGNYKIAPRVPPGWGEWQTFVEDGGDSENGRVYYDYMLNENGVLRHHGSAQADYSTDLLRERSLAYLEDHADAPFFMVYAPFAPHLPALPAARHAGRFAGIGPWRPPNWCEPDVSDKPLWVQFMAVITTPAGIAETDADRIRQLESLLAVDEAVGAIEQRLERLGLADQTVLVYTSDNGLMWREHWWKSKWASYEESIRVPLVLRYPVAVPRALRSEVLALNIDLAPTFVEVAGAIAPPGIDGRSLLGALRGEPWREDFLIQNTGAPVIRPSDAVRTRHAKLIRTRTDGFLELYDLDADPYELENRIGDPAWAGVQATLSARLDELLAQ